MELNHWTNTKNNTVIGLNTQFGSPRSWISRSFDQKLALDAPNMKSQSSLDFREVTCGAIFYRPCRLPDFGDQRVLYRFFSVSKGYNGVGGGRAKDYDVPVPVIGVALAVPVKDFLSYQQWLKGAGAEWIWFAMPHELPKKREVPQDFVPRKNFTYDHKAIYEMLERGMRVIQIVDYLGPGAQQAAVSYIKSRWEKGYEPSGHHRRKEPLNHPEIVSDFKSGMSALAVADKHRTTKSSVYNILDKYGVEKRAYGS